MAKPWFSYLNVPSGVAASATPCSSSSASPPLRTGQIAGAGLDVLVQEPPARDHPLFRLDNVVITPHTAGPTWENWPKAFRNAFDNIQRVARGGEPRWVIPELRA